MRHGQALGLALLTALLAGCATDMPVRSISWFDRMRAFTGPTGPDVLRMDVAVVECPVGDAYLNEELWTFADNAIPLERRAVVEDNGFRVGRLGGITPTRLLELLTSEQTNPKGRIKMLRAGGAVPVPLGLPADVCRFRLHQGGQASDVELEQAECVLKVVPTFADRSKVRLQFTPQVLHGEKVPSPTAVPDGSGYILQWQQPTETYQAMSWEVTLAPNEYVVVGTRFDREESLGHQCFLRRDEPTPVQRLLVIRTSRPAPGVEAGDASEAPAGAAPPPRSPPLAVQAALYSVRGSSP